MRMMRSAALAGGAALALVACFGGGSASAATTPDVVLGAGTLAAAYGTPSVSVVVAGLRDRAIGTVTVAYPDSGRLLGAVTCASVADDTAYVVARIVASSDAAFPRGGYVVVGVRDGGQGNQDFLNFSPAMTSEPACAPSPAATPVLPLASGGFRVWDR